MTTQRPLSLPTYALGTVAVSSAGVVTGNGTNFLSPDGSGSNWSIAQGDIFVCGNAFAPVAQGGVTSATALQLVGWNGGTVAAGSSYYIIRISGLPNSAVVGLVQTLLALGSTSNPFSALSALVGAAQDGKIQFTTDGGSNILLQVRSTATGQTDSNYVTALTINKTTGAIAQIPSSTTPIAPQNFTAGTGSGTFTPGTTTSLTLSPTPASAAAVDVYFNGTLQPSTSWSLAGAVLTFSAAIPVGTTLVTINQRH